MTYDEATRHATWDEALVYALGAYVAKHEYCPAYPTGRVFS